MSIRVITQNLNYNLARKGGWDDIVRSLQPQADVILFQEAKNTDLRKYEDDEWQVFQRSSRKNGDGLNGTGIMWRRSIGTRLADGVFLLADKGKGRKAVKMQDRYLAYVDIEVTELQRVVRFVAGHYPPGRFKKLWPASNRNVDRFIAMTRKAGLAFVMGFDFNHKKTGNQQGIAQRVAVFNTGHRIDGFVVARKLQATPSEDLGNNRSDHNPQRTVISNSANFMRRLTHKK